MEQGAVALFLGSCWLVGVFIIAGIYEYIVCPIWDAIKENIK